MKKFIIAIMLLANMSGCTRSLVVSSGELISNEKKEIVGLQLVDKKKVDLQVGSEVEFKRNRKIVVKHDSLKTKEYLMNSVEYFIINNKNRTDSLRKITPLAYKSSNKLLKNINDYSVSSATYLDNQKVFFKSGTINFDDRTIMGKLYSGENASVKLDTLKYVKFQKPDVGSSILLAIGVVSVVVGFAAYMAFKDFSIGFDSNGY